MKHLVVAVILAVFSMLNLNALEPVADTELKERYPASLVHRDGDRVLVWGTRMGTATSARAAAENWLRQHGALLIEAGEFEETREMLLGHGRFTVFAFRQRVDGVLVSESRARILVREPSHHESQSWSVVLASASGIVDLESAKPTQESTPAEALASVQAHAESQDLDEFDAPTRVIRTVQGKPRVCWQLSARSSDLAMARAFTFFIDVESLEVVDVVSDIFHADVIGTVSGMRTPGMEPDSDANPPVEEPIAEIFVNESGGGDTTTDEDGTYIISGVDAGDVTVESSLFGTWAVVYTEQGSAERVEESGTAPGSFDLLFNTSETEFDTAQVNAFVHATSTHEFYQARSDGLEDLDVSLVCNVNVDDACNAYFTTSGFPSINFFQAGSSGQFDCPNTSYSSVVAHEYGHFIVYALDLAQGAFGEGFADCVSMLQYDDPEVGADFFGPDDPVRDNESTVESYPCSGGVHQCGQVLAGTFWDIKLNFQETFGDEDGLEQTRQLFVDWSAVTLGGDGSDSAHLDTVIEVLTLDDDDGELANGTPNYGDICDAFQNHGLDCPGLDPISFTFPDGRPDRLAFSGTTSFKVVVGSAGGTPEPDSGKLWYRPSGCFWNSVDLVSSGDNEYEVTVPVEICTEAIDYYLEVEDILGIRYSAPSDAPAVVYSALVADEETIVFDDDFEDAEAWSLGCIGDPDTATTGIWVYGDPIGTANVNGEVQPEFDFSADGTFCAFTGQGSAGGAIGEEDVDGGKTTMVSPRLDLSDPGEYQIRYARWYSNHAGLNPGTDTFQIGISDDDGNPGTWVEVETVGPTGVGTTGGWFEHAFNVSDYVAATANVRVRFRAEDLPDALGNGSLVEAAVDEFVVVRYGCTEILQFQRGDCDGDGTFNVSDAVALLSHLFQSGAEPACLDACDASDSGDLSSQDALLLLVAMFQGVSIPEPFGECGDDVSEDSLACNESGCD